MPPPSLILHPWTPYPTLPHIFLGRSHANPAPPRLYHHNLPLTPTYVSANPRDVTLEALRI